MRTPVHPPAACSDQELFAALVNAGRAQGAGKDDPELLYDHKDTLVVQIGEVVLKAHPEEVTAADLATRLRIADTAPGLLTPLGPPLRVARRTVTMWPYGTTVTPEDDPPWEEGARLLARLHRHPIPAGTPACHGWPARVARVVGRISEDKTDPVVAEIRQAFAGLPEWIREPSASTPRTVERLVHGDWHLGQLVQTRADGWRLVDIADLGTGDPAWDLARPAALFAAGLLPPNEWERFLTAYRAAGGPAVPSEGDPWAALELPARAMVVQLTATRVWRARMSGRKLDDQEEPLVDICRRINRSF